MQATVYTKSFCVYTTRALSQLAAAGYSVTEINAGTDKKLKAEMKKRSGGRTTFPQVFIGDEHIGGSDELVAWLGARR
jgi:glutaredoxin 3